MGSRESSSSSRCGWAWTNERHVDFLNSMEASFVRTMFQNNQSPLDRQLPDYCESTLDSRRRPARRHSTSDILDSTRVRIDKRNRRLSYQPYNNSSQDQVVPQSESRRTDEKDHVAPAN